MLEFDHRSTARKNVCALDGIRFISVACGIALFYAYERAHMYKEAVDELEEAMTGFG